MYIHRHVIRYVSYIYIYIFIYRITYTWTSTPSDIYRKPSAAPGPRQQWHQSRRCSSVWPSLRAGIHGDDGTFIA